MVNEIKILKANIMGGMNEYIKELGDNDIWEIWTEVFPAECSEDELMKMVEDDGVCWLNVVERFAYCCKIAGILK